MSKYAKYLLLNLIEYESASTRDKERIDLLVTTNSTGRNGCAVPLDMCCEHKVRTVKELLRNFYNQLEPVLIMKAVSAQNSISLISDHFYDSLGKGHLKSGGEHRKDYFHQEEKDVVRSELRRLKVFGDTDSRSKTVFNYQIRKIWEDLKEENVDIFLDRNCNDYKLKKSFRFN